MEVEDDIGQKSISEVLSRGNDFQKYNTNPLPHE